jgi:hypothetical protein
MPFYFLFFGTKSVIIFSTVYLLIVVIMRRKIKWHFLDRFTLNFGRITLFMYFYYTQVFGAR